MYFQMKKNFVEVREPEGTLVFQLEDLMRYSGPRGFDCERRNHEVIRQSVQRSLPVNRR